MAQDIKKMFQEEKSLPVKPPQDHEKRFKVRLEKAFPKPVKKSKNNKYFFILKIAAVLIIALGVTLFYFKGEDFSGAQIVEEEKNVPVENPSEEILSDAPEYLLSDVSPEFKQIEDFYLASLNIELAKLQINDSNKALIDSFMIQLAGLDEEYKNLNREIKEKGLSEGSVEAMISNLQLRLELLNKLKNKISDINQSKNNSYENHQL